MSLIANLAPVVGGGLAALVGYLAVRRMHKRPKMDAPPAAYDMMGDMPLLPLQVQVPTGMLSGQFAGEAWTPQVRMKTVAYPRHPIKA